MLKGYYQKGGGIPESKKRDKSKSQGKEIIKGNYKQREREGEKDNALPSIAAGGGREKRRPDHRSAWRRAKHGKTGAFPVYPRRLGGGDQ